MLMDWGILGDEKSWRQPSQSWFELWWKQRLTPPNRTAPSQLLLEKAAAAEPAENSNGVSSLEANRQGSLETALPAASATCGRATVASGVQHRQPVGASADSCALEKAGMGGIVVGGRELQLSCGVSQSCRSSSSYHRSNS